MSLSCSFFQWSRSGDKSFQSLFFPEKAFGSDLLGHMPAHGMRLVGRTLWYKSWTTSSIALASGPPQHRAHVGRFHHGFTHDFPVAGFLHTVRQVKVELRPGTVSQVIPTSWGCCCMAHPAQARAMFTCCGVHVKMCREGKTSLIKVLVWCSACFVSGCER